MGSLGDIFFTAGCYIYTGSAMQGLIKRVTRHVKSKKSLHWHIDYLLDCEFSRILKIHLFPSNKKEECQLNQTVRQKLGAQLYAPGFGASDCSDGCLSHLSYLGKKMP